MHRSMAKVTTFLYQYDQYQSHSQTLFTQRNKTWRHIELHTTVYN